MLVQPSPRLALDNIVSIRSRADGAFQARSLVAIAIDRRAAAGDPRLSRLRACDFANRIRRCRRARARRL